MSFARSPTDRMIGVSPMTRAALPAPDTSEMVAAAIPASEWERWLANAKPGDRIVYARGERLPQGAVVVIAAREAGQAGLVHLFHHVAAEIVSGRTTVRIWLFIAARAASSAAAPLALPAPCPRAGDGEAMAAALALFDRAARLGDYAPSNGAIARSLGLADRHSARYLVKKLVQAGEISIAADPARTWPRVVTITATRRSTRQGGAA